MSQVQDYSSTKLLLTRLDSGVDANVGASYAAKFSVSNNACASVLAYLSLHVPPCSVNVTRTSIGADLLLLHAQTFSTFRRSPMLRVHVKPVLPKALAGVLAYHQCMCRHLGAGCTGAVVTNLGYPRCRQCSHWRGVQAHTPTISLHVPRFSRLLVPAQSS